MRPDRAMNPDRTMSRAPALLSAADVRLDRDGRSVLSDISCEFRAGEFVIIVGRNGAGKSTLLRALAGLLRCQGDIQIEGVDLAGLTSPRRAQSLAYLPQGGQAHWPMPVRDVVALGRLPFGASLQRPGASDALAIAQAMADCELEPLAERPVTLLSGGELSRVLLARALASDTPVLLADEPAASLDPGRQLATMDLLARKAASGKLVVAVSHDIGLAVRYAGRMLVLENGALAADDTPGALLDSGLLERIFGVRFHRVRSVGENGKDETLVALGPGPV